MKKTLLSLLVIVLLAACTNNEKKIPDVSGIKVNLTMERFDQDLFSLDTNSLDKSLSALYNRYPTLVPVFLNNILGLDEPYFNQGIKQFINLSQPLRDSINKVFSNTDFLKKDFTKAFQFVKYYFPQYKEPRIITVIGPVDFLAQTSNGYTPDFLGPDFLGISLQFYLGNNFSLYNEPEYINKVAPRYRSRRFSKEYIIADCMQLIVDDVFPDKSSARPLIEQMIEKGKQWWMLDKFLPATPDSIKTGYTKQQLDWCNENEGLIWTYILKNEDINSVNPTTIQNYIGEAPFTQGFSPELSPGNIGQWIGWQIVKKFADNNPKLKPEDVMKTPARKILEEAKYKPK